MVSAIVFLACKRSMLLVKWCLFIAWRTVTVYWDDFHQVQHILLTGGRSIHKHLHLNRLWSLSTTMFHIVNLSFTCTFHLCHYFLYPFLGVVEPNMWWGKEIDNHVVFFTIGMVFSILHRSLASKFKACNAQGRIMICLCLSLSKQQNLIMVLGLSVQQNLISTQLMQLEFTMFDTSNSRFSAVCLSFCWKTKNFKDVTFWISK